MKIKDQGLGIVVSSQEATVQAFRTLPGVLLPVVLAAFTSAAQEPVDSLKDLARRSGGTANSKIDSDSPAMSLGQLAQTADLIIRGRLTSITPRLSDDESTVFRDFTVTPISAIKQPPELLRASRPGPLQMLTLRQVGGTIVVDGLTLRTTTNFEDRETPMVPKQEYFLFLSKALPSRSTTISTGSEVYQLSSAHWGAFPIHNGKVGNFTKWVAQRTDRNTDDPSAFAALIRDLARPVK
ncbi:MAG: hypothetical protein ABIS06_01960 [Vicinamibacterales bacterium]